MKASQVRDLARRYAAGQLSQENYRSQRRVLIDAISAGEQALAYRETAVRMPGRSGKIKLMAVTAVVILLVAVALKLTWRAARSSRKPAPTSTAPAPPPLPAPGPDLVRDFVEANDWSDGSLEGLSQHWMNLTAMDQGNARQSLMYPRLVTGLREQITSEKAVAGAMGGQDAHLMELTKVAKTLNIPASP
jgi:hypothetical protein